MYKITMNVIEIVLPSRDKVYEMSKIEEQPKV